MKSEIHIIAEAILANTQVLKMLVEKLPDAVREEVAKKVEEVNPTPAPAPVQAPEPVVVAPAPVAPPVVAAPVPTPAPAPVAQPAPVATPEVTAGVCPFKDAKGMIQWIMNCYREMGAEGLQIQKVMDGLGIKNINDTKPEQYQALYTGVENLLTEWRKGK